MDTNTTRENAPAFVIRFDPTRDYHLVGYVYPHGRHGHFGTVTNAATIEEAIEATKEQMRIFSKIGVIRVRHEVDGWLDGDFWVGL